MAMMSHKRRHTDVLLTYHQPRSWGSGAQNVIETADSEAVERPCRDPRDAEEINIESTILLHNAFMVDGFLTLFSNKLFKWIIKNYKTDKKYKNKKVN